MAIAIATTAAAVDAGYGRSVLIRYFAWRIGRPIRVDGPLRARIFLRNPRVTAEAVTIGNPPWMPAGSAAEVQTATVVLAWPRFGHPSDIVELAMEGTTLHLVRDAEGRANWQLNDPGKPQVRGNSPILRSLSVPNAHVVLSDAVRHLQFVGTVSAHDPGGPGSEQPLRIEGTGQLNGREAVFRIIADALGTASHNSPYHLRLVERSGGSRLSARTSLPQPFDFRTADTTFTASGPDLRDLYFLTGVTLLDTGSYRLSGKASLRGTRTRFTDLVVTTGQSDVRGTLSIDSSSAPRKLVLALDSQLLHLSDFGIRAAGRTTAPESSLLLSDATLSRKVLTSADTKLSFGARSADLGRLHLHDVSIKASVDHGVLTVAPLSAEVLGSSVNGRLVLDARKAVPAATVDLTITGLPLGNIPHKEPGNPPFEGQLQARITVTGSGSSIHEVAASANGTVSAELPQGSMRASFAELAGGVDLRGLGLLLTHSQHEVPVHCAIATFKAVEGTLVAQKLVADTGPTLITGEGRIHMDSETLDLVIQGYPKKPRFLRLRGPLLVGGTLAHPSISAQQTDRTPLIVDPARAENADCSELLSNTKSGSAPAGTGAWQAAAGSP